jgi:hypothetical protein
MDNGPISEPLKKAVRESGMTVNQVANAAGISQPGLWRFMAVDDASHRDLLVERTADKLAAYFGLELTAVAKKVRKEKPRSKNVRRRAER